MTKRNNTSANSLTGSFSSDMSSGSFPEEDYVPLALPGSSLLKTSFYPTHTSMTNLNKCFSARYKIVLFFSYEKFLNFGDLRYIRSRQRQMELEKEKEEKKKEPLWEEPPALHDPVAERNKKDNPHWLQVGHSVFCRNNTGIFLFMM